MTNSIDEYKKWKKIALRNGLKIKFGVMSRHQGRNYDKRIY